MSDFLAFRKMITPGIIQFIFWCEVIASIAVALYLFTSGDSEGFALPLSPKLMGVLILVLGPLLARIYCELLIVLFRIYESLRAIERNTARE
jgi:Domain of unknown function (DUF4282)